MADPLGPAVAQTEKGRDRADVRDVFGAEAVCAQGRVVGVLDGGAVAAQWLAADEVQG